MKTLKPLATYAFGFDWDDGYGVEYICSAEVEIRFDHEEQEPYPFVTALDVDHWRGDDVSDHVLKCCDEKAQDIAWGMWEAAHKQEKKA